MRIKKKKKKLEITRKKHVAHNSIRYKMDYFPIRLILQKLPSKIGKTLKEEKETKFKSKGTPNTIRGAPQENNIDHLNHNKTLGKNNDHS